MIFPPLTSSIHAFMLPYMYTVVYDVLVYHDEVLMDHDTVLLYLGDFEYASW